MPDFTKNGTIYEYSKPDGFTDPKEVRCWGNGKYPKVSASVPSVDGWTVDLYAKDNRWSPTNVSVQWVDDLGAVSWRSVPKGNARPAMD